MNQGTMARHRRYLIVQCTSMKIDRKTGEPYRWSYRWDAHDAQRLAAACEARWPDVFATVLEDR